jgi:hypothetical protein
MLYELARSGFEAACISSGSLRAYNKGQSWTRLLGYYPSDLIEGCPVLPRWGFGASVRNALLVAAYLGQPLIVRGHHQDLKGGLGLLDELAAFINGLGDVLWSNLTDLSRMNYLWQMEGTSCRLRPLGRRTAFDVPNGATEVVMGSPTPGGERGWYETTVDGHTYRVEPGERLALSKQSCRRVQSRWVPSQPQQAGIELLRGTPATLILRRLLTEARDRFLA